MIEVKKLDGSTMHLNEDLVERVEGGAEGQSAVYLRDGGHYVIANTPTVVVAMIRAEKVQLLREAFLGLEPDAPDEGPRPTGSRADLRQVRDS